MTANYGNYNTKFELSESGRQDIKWWFDHIMSSERCVESRPPTVITESDASKGGWGALCDGKRTGGDLTADEADKQINVLEVKAGCDCG